MEPTDCATLWLGMRFGYICLWHPQQGWKWTLTCGASTSFSEQKWIFFAIFFQLRWSCCCQHFVLIFYFIFLNDPDCHTTYCTKTIFHMVLAWPEQAKAFFCMMQKQDQVLDHSLYSPELVPLWLGIFFCVCVTVLWCFFVLQNWRNGWQERNLTRPRTSQKLSVQSSV